MAATRRKSAAPAEKQPPTFEAALTRLEKLVEELEQGDLSLDDAVARYEEATTLQKACLQQLEAAEKRLLLLSGEAGPAPIDVDPAE